MTDALAPQGSPAAATPTPAQAPNPAGAAPPDAAPTAAEAERLSPKFAAAAKREAQAFKKMQAATTKEQQIAAREEALSAREAKLAEFEKLRSDPLKALDYLGTDYSKLTDIMMNGGNKPVDMLAEEKVEKRLADWEAKQKADQEERQTKAQREAQERAEAAEKEATTKFLASVDTFLDEKKDRFPLSAMYKRSDLVYDVIDAHYKMTLEKAQKVDPSAAQGEIMSVEDAALRVERHLLDEALKLKPILDRAQAPTAQPPVQRQVAPSQQAWVEKPVKTLSNSLQPQTASAQTRVLNDEERMRNALARLQASRGR